MTLVYNIMWIYQINIVFAIDYIIFLYCYTFLLYQAIILCGFMKMSPICAFGELIKDVNGLPR